MSEKPNDDSRFTTNIINSLHQDNITTPPSTVITNDGTDITSPPSSPLSSASPSPPPPSSMSERTATTPQPPSMSERTATTPQPQPQALPTTNPNANNPLQELNQYYQILRIPASNAEHFHDISVTIDGKPHWRSSWHCPATSNVYYSHDEVLIHMSSNDKDNTTNDDIRYHNGHYYHKSKKASRKSAARVTLRALLTNNNAMIPSSNTTTTPSSPSQHQPQDQFHSPKKSSLSIPRWALPLHKLNLSPSHLSLTFHSHHNSFSPPIITHSHHTHFLTTPTRLSCTLSLFRPLSFKSIGHISSNKRNAVRSAIVLIKEEFKRRNVVVVGRDEGGVWNLPGVVRYDGGMGVMEDWKMERRRWGVMKGLERGGEEGQVYLYEMRFEGSGCERARTRMGILFAERLPTLSTDDETTTEPISVTYNLNNDPHNNDAASPSSNNMTVTFSNERSIPLSTIYEHESMIVAFHEMILNWKSYGLAGMANAGTPEALRQGRLDGRDHLLLPIIACDDGGIGVNWELMVNVTQGRMIPYLHAMDSHWPFIPLVGQLSRIFLCRVCVGLCLAVVAPVIIRPLLHGEIIGGVILAGMALFWWLMTLIIPPRRMISYSDLDNYFLIQKGIPNNTLYISHHDTTTSHHHPPPHPNGYSPFLSPSARSSLTMAKNDYNIRQFNLNLATATYEQYYTHKYGIDVTYPHLPLLPAHPVQKHVDFDLWMDHRPHNARDCPASSPDTPNPQNQPVHLLPELVHLFPLPRDVLYIPRHVTHYLPPLHRYVHLTHLSRRLLSLASHLTPPSPSRTHPLLPRTLPSLLEESLSIHPCTTYNRLEFLGDSVLRFFSSLVLFKSNAMLIYDVEEMELLLGRSLTNKMLFERGLSLGLDGVVLRKEEGWEMSDKVISDVLEALVAVGYLWDERLCVALLNEMRLPLVPKEQCKEGESWFTPYNDGKGSGGGGGACLVMGYDFNNDDEWFKELVNVGMIIYNLEEVSVALERGFTMMKGRYSILGGATGTTDAAATTGKNNDEGRLHRNKVLLMAALFDDSLGYRSDTGSSKGSASKGSKTFHTTGGGSSLASGSLVSLGSSNALDDSRHSESTTMSTPDKNDPTRSTFQRTMSDISTNTSNVSDDDNDDASVTGLERVALLRDTLFVIGNAALHLISSQQSYLNYPNATAGDLHMLKTCAISDDVLAYVMIESGLYECLYDRENVTLWDLRDVVQKSDEIGRRVWETKGTRERVKVPKYVGLAGGRLYETNGHDDNDDASPTNKKTMTKKLDPKMTEDVAFSFKAIVGALVLGLGMGQMWEGVVKELLGELLSLSPEELRREYGEVSDICKNYQKGYESALVKDVR